MSPAAPTDTARVRAAGLRFLAQAQSPSGEVPVMMTQQVDGREVAVVDTAVFPTALAVHALRDVAGAHGIRSQGCAFLTREMKNGGVWSHWPADHPTTLVLPPDLDDTVCASLALGVDGRVPIGNRPLILNCRDGRGLFRTWILADLRWRGRAHWRATWRQWLHRPTRFMFFRRTAAAPADVDAVVNANVLAWLGDFEGRETVADWLLAILIAGEEEWCDKWYDDAVVVRYFFARALADHPRAKDIIVERTLATAPRSALHRALMISTLAMVRTAAPAGWLAALHEAQASDGSWASAPFYSGGRPRRGDGRCDPTPATQARWGSAALTTAFCLEALGQADERS